LSTSLFAFFGGPTSRQALFELARSATSRGGLSARLGNRLEDIADVRELNVLAPANSDA
jgi:hypothetical protein